MNSDGIKITELTDNQLDVLKAIIIQEKSIRKGKIIEKPKPKGIEYNFSKVNLKNFSKKHLIRIIYGLQEELNQYKELFNDVS